MLVRAERHYGDELTEVHLREVDTRTVYDLQSFVETGRCNPALFDKLKNMAPKITPLVLIDDALSNAELRECICAAYVIETGIPIDISVKFRQQLK